MDLRRYTDPNEIIQLEPRRVTVGEVQARCSLVEPGIVLMRELPRSSLGTFQVAMSTLLELAEPFERFAIINDVTEAAHRPKGEYFDAIVEAATTIGVHWAIVVAGNIVIRTVSRFIMGRVLREGARAGITWSVHESVESGIVAARTALYRAGGP